MLSVSGIFHYFEMIMSDIFIIISVILSVISIIISSVAITFAHTVFQFIKMGSETHRQPIQTEHRYRPTSSTGPTQDTSRQDENIQKEKHRGVSSLTPSQIAPNLSRPPKPKGGFGSKDQSKDQSS